MDVIADRVVFCRGVRRIRLEFVGHVDVDGVAEAVQLPVARHVDHVPVATVVAYLVETIHDIIRALCEVESPTSVEVDGIFFGRTRNHVGARRHFVDLKHRQIVPPVADFDILSLRKKR